MAKHPVPKKRMSKARRDSRRAHDSLSGPNLVSCAQCSELKPSHVVCPHCGSYGGKQVLDVDNY